MVEKILNNRQLETMPQYMREQNDSSIIFTGKCLPTWLESLSCTGQHHPYRAHQSTHPFDGELVRTPKWPATCGQFPHAPLSGKGCRSIP